MPWCVFFTTRGVDELLPQAGDKQERAWDTTRDDRFGYEGRELSHVGHRVQIGGDVSCQVSVNKVMSPRNTYKTKTHIKQKGVKK